MQRIVLLWLATLLLSACVQPPQTVSTPVPEENKVTVIGTQQIYLGYWRGRNFSNAQQFIADEKVNYSALDNLQQNAWSLNGYWTVGKDYSVSNDNEARLSLKFTAKDVYLTASPAKSGAKILVMVDNLKVKQTGLAGADVNADSEAEVNSDNLFHLVHSDNLLSGKTITITVPAGMSVYSFTFGN